MNKSRDLIIGTSTIIIATSAYGLFGIFSREVSDGFKAFSQSYVRYLILLIIISIILAVRKGWVKVNKKDIKWLTFWSIIGAFSLPCSFVAFNNLPLGTAYLLIYSTMIIFGFIVGKILFDEKLNLIKVISILFSLIGLAIMFTVNINSGLLVFVIVALLAGASTGIWNSSSKALSDKYPTLQMQLFNAIGTAGIALIIAFVIKEPAPSLEFSKSWIWMLGFVLAQIIATSFIIIGFKKLEAQVASLIMPIEVIFAMIFGYLFYSEIPTISTIIGGVFVMISALLPSIVAIRDNKN